MRIICVLFSDPLEQDATIYSAAFDNKENRKPEEKYPSFHPVESTGKGSPGKSAPRQKKHPKASKPSPLDGVDEKIKQVPVFCYFFNYQIC